MVTIRDLCETNPSIVDIEIDLRSSTGQLEHTYRIGGGAPVLSGGQCSLETVTEEYCSKGMLKWLDEESK